MSSQIVSIQGEPGAFHHIACEQYFGSDAQVLFRKTFGQVFDDLLSGDTDYAIVAIENTEFGIISEVKDSVAKHSLEPIDEINVHVNFCLLGTPHSELDIIRDVYSQSPALVACKKFIDSKLQGAKITDYYDTAGAAKLVSEQKDPAMAAIASQRAGEIYGLKVLAEDIENHPENITRFLVLRADSKR